MPPDGVVRLRDTCNVYALRDGSEAVLVDAGSGAVFDRLDELGVERVTDVLVTKLLALKEHEVDYDSVLEVARACREQIDWDVLRERTEDSPYAKAFFTLAEELGLSTQTA